ncbi:MAG TPA: exosortase/archaeosortase family protein [Candidatus Sulfotelmatobacter sp.]|nr:exosortase/archaeosortase family protein [Candidatus Sulfotelmatobacter sp.]
MNETQPIKNIGDFQRDTADCWQRLPNKTFFFVLLAAWLALFQFLGNSVLGYVHTPSLFTWMYRAYNNSDISDDGDCMFVPFLVVGLFWWKRHELLDSRLQLWGPGLGVLILGIILHLLAYVAQLPHISIVALFVGIYGIMGLAWGTEWLRKSFFPFFLFAFSVPLGTHATFITFPLRLLVTWLVEVTAHLFGIGIVREGTRLIDPTGSFEYDVVAACSGIRSLFATFLLATVYGFFTFRSAWKRLFLMSLALPFAVLGNFLRLFMVIVAAEIGGEKLGNFVHDNWISSLMPYAPAFIGLFLVGNYLEKCVAKSKLAKAEAK